MTGTLLLTRGLPASGKSTFAKAWVALDPARRARTNRDDLRLSVHGGYQGFETEQQITEIQQATAETLLKRNIDVICDDTNLTAKFVKEWLALAQRLGAEVEWHDEFLDVPLEECIRRDRERTGTAQVGEKVIRNFHSRFLNNGPLKRPELPVEALTTTEPYNGTPGKPDAILVDIDGTIASNPGTRSFFDWSKVGEDEPVQTIIDIVTWAESAGVQPIFVSGRDGSCESLTAEWISKHVYGGGGFPTSPLFMRRAGDQRQDSIVKLEIFDNNIRDNYNVLFCLDDRDQVVKAYRGIGLTVLQVREGAF